MKGMFSFFAFILLAIMLVMPPGKGYAYDKQNAKADIVQADLSQTFIAPDLEVMVSSCATCTGEEWVTQAYNVQWDRANFNRYATANRYVLRDLTKNSMRIAEADINLRETKFLFEYSMRLTC